MLTPHTANIVVFKTNIQLANLGQTFAFKTKLVNSELKLIYRAPYLFEDTSLRGSAVKQ